MLLPVGLEAQRSGSWEHFCFCVFSCSYFTCAVNEKPSAGLDPNPYCCDASQGLELISKIQKPMDEEEAAIMARMKQLLEQDSKEVGPLQNAIPSPKPHARLSNQLASATKRTPDTAAAAGSMIAKAAPSEAASVSSQSAVISRPPSVHQELLQLGERLDAIHNKLKW
jgi:hypothetical protein